MESVRVSPIFELSQREAELVGEEALGLIAAEYEVCMGIKDRVRDTQASAFLSVDDINFICRSMVHLLHTCYTHCTFKLRVEFAVWVVPAPLLCCAPERQVLRGHVNKVRIHLDWPKIVRILAEARMAVDRHPQPQQRIENGLALLLANDAPVLGLKKGDFTHSFAHPFGLAVTATDQLTPANGEAADREFADRIIKVVADLPLGFNETPEGEFIFNVDALLARAKELKIEKDPEVERFIAWAHVMTPSTPVFDQSPAQFTVVNCELALGNRLTESMANALLEFAKKSSEVNAASALEFADKFVECGGTKEHLLASVVSGGVEKQRYVRNAVEKHQSWIREQLRYRAIRCVAS